MSLNTQQSNSPKGDYEAFRKYSKYWYVFLISILICLGSGWLYLANAIRLYKVTAALLIQNDIKGDGLLKGTAFSDLDMFHGPKTVDNEMEVLRSRDLIQQTLKDLSLEIRYALEGKFNDKELYGSTLPVQIIVNNLTNKAYSQKLNLIIKDEKTFLLQNEGKYILYRFNQPIKGPGYSIKVIKGPAFRTDFPSIRIGFRDLYTMAESYSLSALTILPIVKDANTVTISLLDALPERGVDILNKLIETYNAENVNTKNMVAINTIHFIDQRLNRLSADLSNVERGVESYKQFNRITNMGADAEINLRTSGSYDQELSLSQLQLDLIESLQQYLSSDASNNDIVPSTLGLKDLTLSNLINKYNDMQIERQRLLRNNNPDNPLIVNVNEQLSALKSSLQENLRNVQSGLNLEKNNLLAKSNQFESKVRNVPVVERGLLQLTRDQSVKSGLYQYLLQKREETALSLSATIPTSQIIDKPAYNSVPAKPKVALIYLGSLFSGFLLPLFFFYSRDLLNTKVQDATDVQLLGGTRILGELSHKIENNTVVVKRGSRTTISELFRYIQSNLGYITDNSVSQILLVTSGMKGEGKTFFCINLGITLSMVGKKVVILELDLRKPDLMREINVKYDKGLADYLESNDMDVDEIIKPTTASSNVFVIGAGKLPDDPAHLLSSNKIQSLLDELKDRFDFVILDTSPVGMVADAFSLAPYADASIYLVRYNFTERTQLSVLEDICKNNKLKNLMIVFNDAKKQNMKSYGYASNRYAYAVNQSPV